MAGYSRLATLFGNHNDLAHFRRFSVLNAQSLIYMQGEITHLEAELRMIAQENRNATDSQKTNFECSISTLMGPHALEDGHEQWAKILEIREKLKDYNEAILRWRKICTFEQANRSDLASLQHWLQHEHGGECFLKGLEANTWHKSNEEDLISMTHRYQDKDILWKWIDIYIIPSFHRIVGHWFKNPEKLYEKGSITAVPLCHYRDSVTHAVIDTLSTILASLLPTVPAFVLYSIHSPLAKLGAILAFTVVFSALLAIVARASGVERFAATTAFAAVLMVFVGNFGNTCMTS